MIRPSSPTAWLADRYSERGLARAVVVLAVALVLTQALVGWYVGQLGLSLREVAHSNDDRTVVVDPAAHAAFARHYDPGLEEGWCLYGSSNDTHVRVDAAVNARPLSQQSDRVEFTCVPETARHLASGRSTGLVGVAHSHPSRNRSRPSRIDAVTWGRVSPLVEVMGIYTERDGVEFFTLRSLAEPLDKRVAERTATAAVAGPEPRDGATTVNSTMAL